MRKRFLVFLVIAALVFSLSGCGRDSFEITLSVQCDSEVTAVRVEYYVGEDAVGGQMASLTPENDVVFEKGESISLLFSKADFPEDAEIKNFRMELFLTLADGEEIFAASLGIAAKYGKAYHYSIHGSEEDGFRLQRG